MSYTNKTPNYELPQYVADDKPTYLGDFNKAMLDIDTAIKNASDTATGSQTIAQNANNISSEALNTAQSASTSATSANTKADNAYTLAQNAQTVAENAQTEAGEAKTLAQNANQTATNAKTTAETANSSAQSAVSTANSAQSTATNVQNTLNNLVKNTLTESDTETYSTNYINQQLKNIDGTVAWKNPNPSQDFAGGNIDLSLSKNDYDMYEVVFADHVDGPVGSSGLIPMGYNTRMIGVASQTLSWREIYTNLSSAGITDTQINITNGKQAGQETNYICIPLVIIFYKTNINF